MLTGEMHRFELHLNPAEHGGSIRDKEYLRFIEMLNGEGIRSYVQPIVDLYTGSVFGYELLARGVGKYFSPTELFAAAQKWQLLQEVEYACRRAALKKVSLLSEDHAQASFFVNISPTTFSKPEFQTGFSMKNLDRYGVSGERLVLEITETESVKDYGHFEEIIRAYVEQGFRIALDDFGSGHSGLITLVATAPHFLKIDRELVRGIHRSSYKENLVKAVSDFAENVGSSILMEGVETRDELRMAYRLGARFAQGFFLGVPEEKPGILKEEAKKALEEMKSEYLRKTFAVDVSIYQMVTRPTTFFENTMTGEELDKFFRTRPAESHVVVVDKDDHPRGLITREHFYSHVSGQYGYAIYRKKKIESQAKREMLIVEESTDLRILGKIAMGRSNSELYEPVVVVDESGKLVGTITMKKVIDRAFDTEVKFATNANPLTGLPGNVVINVWMEDLLRRAEYTIAYLDLDHFKEFNDHYGFCTGDDMIKLLAETLSEYVEKYREENESPCRLGHVGGDDFVLLAEQRLEENFFQELCNKFDENKKRLFSEADVLRGSYIVVNRRGETEEVPLVTLSVAVVTDRNFTVSPHPGRLGQTVAHLKQKIKEINYRDGTSGFLFERRMYTSEGLLPSSL
jgi:diguanylate cyclase (GGDEF)-like protein